MKKVVGLISLILILSSNVVAQQEELSPSETQVVVNFYVTDYDKIPEAGADLKITLTSGKVLQKVTGDDGKLQALIDKGEECTMVVNKFGKEFVFDDKLKITSNEGYYVQNHTLKIRLTTEYVRKYVLKGVNFDTNKWDLRADAQRPVKQLLKVMEKNAKMKIELAGHTDSVGKDEDNMLLSQRRAASVRQYLINNGISENRILAKGYGETSPIATNDTPEGRQENRRTEVRVLEE